MEYNKVKRSGMRPCKKVERMQQSFEKVYKEIPEARTEMEALVEEQVTKISEAIQGFHTHIVDLEVCT
jgi:uncharacterized coiled-coil DUF342 family protein